MINEPFKEAVLYGDLEAVKSFVKNGVDINATNQDLDTPLHLAAARGHDSVAEYLVECGAKVDLGNDVGATPLYYALEKKLFRLVCRLVDKVDDLNRPIHGAGDRAIHGAVRNGLDYFNLIVDKGNSLDINAKGDYNLTPLHLACLRGHLDVVKRLVDLGADIHADKNGTTAFDFAKQENHGEIVKYLGEIVPSIVTNSTYSVPDSRSNSRAQKDNSKDLSDHDIFSAWKRGREIQPKTSFKNQPQGLADANLRI